MEEGKNTQFKDIIRQTRLYLKSLHRKRPFRRWTLFAGIIFIVYMTISICSCPRVRTFALRFTDRPEDRISTKTFSPDRGQIFDSAGNVIATNKDVYDIHLDCCVIEDPRVWEEKSRKLAQEIALVLPERTAPQWWDYLQHARRNKKRYLPIAKNVESDILDTLKKLTLLDEPTYKGGRIVTSKQMRDYPYENLARRTIGAGRYVWDEFRFGIENAYNGDLDGEEGIRRTKHGYRRGKWCQSVLEYKPEVDGWDIYTTLNMEYQAVADSALRSAVETDDDIAGGCLALMEVGTGEIKALANIHRLDNGNIGEYLNYSIGYSYEPGEIAQTMTLAAALSDRLISGLDEKIPTNHGKVSDTTANLIQKRFVENKELTRLSVQSFLYSSLADFASQIELCDRSADDDILAKAIAFMRKHKESQITINKVAEGIGYSKSHLSYVINRAAGFGYNTLLSMLRIEDARTLLRETQKSILEIRVENAKKLLRESEKTIFDIIIECGFGSERSFYRQFKAIIGKSPHEYRVSRDFKHMKDPIAPQKKPILGASRGGKKRTNAN